MNRPRNVLLQHADPREPVTLDFHHTVGALKHSIEIHQSPDEDTWPGGALWDCGVLLSELVLAVAGIEDVTLQSTYLEESSTSHIVSATPTKDTSRHSDKTKRKLATKASKDKQLQQTRTTTHIATRLQAWIQSQSNQNSKNSKSNQQSNYRHIWKNTVEETLCHTPSLRVLELGCGVGLTGLVASSVLGAGNYHEMPRAVLGAEDWSYVLQEVPGTMMFLGGTHHDRDASKAPANHSNLVVFDEDAMPYGVELYAQMALRHLGATA